jgi:hypothetical protein
MKQSLVPDPESLVIKHGLVQQHKPDRQLFCTIDEGIGIAKPQGAVFAAGMYSQLYGIGEARSYIGLHFGNAGLYYRDDHYGIGTRSSISR